MTVHISPNQHSLIVLLRDGKRVRWSAGIDAHCYVETRGFPRVTSTALALERKGYVERYKETHTGCDLRLTDKAKELK